MSLGPGGLVGRTRSLPWGCDAERVRSQENSEKALCARSCVMFQRPCGWLTEDWSPRVGWAKGRGQAGRATGDEVVMG